MEIKDLAGLSEPLTKLIEVCSKGLGNITEPSLIKARAKAKAFEIETISQALLENNNQLSNQKISYADGEIEVIVDNEKVMKNELEIMKHEIENRKFHQEFKKQRNINKTINFTIEELEKEEHVSNEKVDEDWITKYFNTIENISNERLQRIWAKILAGEIKKPNTCSLRTMEFLKSISTEEANIFSDVAKYTIISGDDNSHLLLGYRMTLEQKFKIDFEKLILLQEIGLLFSSNSIKYSLENHKKEEKFLFGDKVLIVGEDKDSPKVDFPVFKFTKIGTELLNFMEINFNEKYFKVFIKELRKSSPDIKVYISSVLDRENLTYNLEKREEIK